jgi:GST-like protein
VETIQLYSLATPNGQKVSVALEELEIPYEAHRIDIINGDQFTDEFIAINPNSKIPAIVDPVGDQGQPLSIMESGAILVYLAEKAQRLLPSAGAERSRVLQWLFFQVGGPGPMFGQFGHFYKYAKDKCEHPYPVERYQTETKRLLTVIDQQLRQQAFIAGDEYSIADIAIAPWVTCLDHHYNAGADLQLSEYENVQRWLQSFLERPAVQRGMKVCAI